MNDKRRLEWSIYVPTMYIMRSRYVLFLKALPCKGSPLYHVGVRVSLDCNCIKTFNNELTKLRNSLMLTLGSN